MEPSAEQASVEERKQQVQVRNALGWGKINALIKWLNPGGERNSLILPWMWDFEFDYMVRTRNALGWGKINEFIKTVNPCGQRDSLSR